MTSYRNRASYADCYLAMDEALRKGRTVLKFFAWVEVHNTLQRFSAARQRQRAENARIYPVGHEMYARSVYDRLHIYGSRITNEITISVEEEMEDV